jgi:hypothetical protein
MSFGLELSTDFACLGNSRSSGDTLEFPKEVDESCDHPKEVDESCDHPKEITHLQIIFLDPAGCEQVTISRTTHGIDDGCIDEGSLRTALEAFYQSLGCCVLSVQRSVERIYDISERRAPVKLSLIQGGKSDLIEVDIRL